MSDRTAIVWALQSRMPHPGSGERWALAALVAVPALLIALPLGLLGATAIAPRGEWAGLGAAAEALASRALRVALWNSLESATLSATAATAAGAGLALLAVQHAPLAFLVTLAALRGLPREMADAALVSGAGPAGVLRRVVLPLPAPSLIAGFALAFVSALGNFGIPALLRAPGRHVTLPVLIWQCMSGFGPSMLPTLAVLSTLIALVAALAAGLAAWLQHRARTALIGPPQAALRWRLGRARPWAEAGVWALIFACRWPRCSARRWRRPTACGWDPGRRRSTTSARCWGSNR